MRDDEVRVVHLPVDRERGEVDAGETADREDGDEAEREQHRRLEVMLPRQSVASQLKIFIPVGTAITIEASMNQTFRYVGIPTVNMWCAQTSIEKNPIATVESAIAL